MITDNMGVYTIPVTVVVPDVIVFCLCVESVYWDMTLPET